MIEMTPGNPETLGLADEPVSDYLQQLRAMEVDALEYPVQSRVLLLTGAKLLRLGNMIEEQIAIEWNEAPPAEAFQQTRPSIEAFLKLARQADRFVRLSHDLQGDQQSKNPGRPR